MKARNSIMMLILLSAMLASCGEKKQAATESAQAGIFKTEDLLVPDVGGRKVRGQVLYMPIYSNIPFDDKQQYGLGAFLAVHNTDLKSRLKITKVLLFNTEGRAVKNYLEAEHVLGPLATAVFTVQPRMTGGTGANFMVEWMSEQPVSEPLVESVMKDLSGDRGVSFLSTGRVVREVP